MNFCIPNTNSSLTAVRRASDGTVTLVPIVYWAELRYRRVPVDLTCTGTELLNIAEADFAVHDASDGRVYLRDGNVFDTLEAFEEATGD